MKEMTKLFGALTLVVALTLFVGASALDATENVTTGNETAAVLPAELMDDGAPGPGCDLPAEVPRLEVQPPKATPASGSSGSFYVCFDSTFLCGECPSGTHCATEACGSTFNPQCTFRFSCVSSCIVTNCTAIVRSCNDF